MRCLTYILVSFIGFLPHYSASMEGGCLSFQEDFEPEQGATTTMQIKRTLERVVSDFQTISVYETCTFGKMLVIDGIIMITEYDNFAYHEMIAHVPMHEHPCPKKILIIGGGDGGTLREVLRHGSVQEVVLCEIDKEVIRVAKKHFPDLAQGFKDPRVSVHIGCAAQYVKTKKKLF